MLPYQDLTPAVREYPDGGVQVFFCFCFQRTGPIYNSVMK